MPKRPITALVAALALLAAAARRPTPRTRPARQTRPTRSRRSTRTTARDGKIEVCDHEREDLQDALDTIEPDFDTDYPDFRAALEAGITAPRRRPLRRRRRRPRRPRPRRPTADRDEPRRTPATLPADRRRRLRRRPARSPPEDGTLPPEDGDAAPEAGATAAPPPPAPDRRAAGRPATTARRQPDAGRSSPARGTGRPADPGHPARHRAARRGRARRVRARRPPLAALRPRLARGRVPHPRNVGGFLGLAAPRPLSRASSARIGQFLAENFAGISPPRRAVRSTRAVPSETRCIVSRPQIEVRAGGRHRRETQTMEQTTPQTTLTQRQRPVRP